MSRQETAIYRSLRKSQIEGKLAAKLDAKALARYFLSVAQGINVIHKVTADSEALNDIARIALSVLRHSQ